MKNTLLFTLLGTCFFTTVSFGAATSINKLILQPKESTNLECAESITINPMYNMAKIDRSLIKQTVSANPLKIEQIDDRNEDGEKLMTAYIVKSEGGDDYPMDLYERVEIKFDRDSLGNEYYAATIETQALNYLNSAEVAEGHGTCVYKNSK